MKAARVVGIVVVLLTACIMTQVASTSHAAIESVCVATQVEELYGDARLVLRDPSFEDEIFVEWWNLYDPYTHELSWAHIVHAPDMALDGEYVLMHDVMDGESGSAWTYQRVDQQSCSSDTMWVEFSYYILPEPDAEPGASVFYVSLWDVRGMSLCTVAELDVDDYNLTWQTAVFKVELVPGQQWPDPFEMGIMLNSYITDDSAIVYELVGVYCDAYDYSVYMPIVSYCRYLPCH